MELVDRRTVSADDALELGGVVNAFHKRHVVRLCMMVMLKNRDVQFFVQFMSPI